ncbi:MAG TPA: hypothetical protein VMV77_11915 [Bacteroidales bacterium]|nr:hypothetical protein [Bacteroidales bacterium]
MKLLYILLAQSVTGAVITIIALLLVAAIIGYLTAWFYAKSVYTPIIKGLEEDKAELNKQIAGLKEDITKLNGKVEKLNESIGKLEKEIVAKDKEIEHLKKPMK